MLLGGRNRHTGLSKMVELSTKRAVCSTFPEQEMAQNFCHVRSPGERLCIMEIAHLIKQMKESQRLV